MTPEPLPPGGTIGILGGGQLGRMLSIAAARHGLRTHIFEPAPAPPAGDVAAHVTTADYTDTNALTAFANSVDVVTLEFENVPVAAVEHLAQIVPVRPGREALRIAQDRLVEKSFIAGLGIPTAPYRDITDPENLSEALRDLGGNGILKTRRLGYDGKGQVRITAEDGLAEAASLASQQQTILEGYVDFSAEISVIGARGLGGEVACFDPAENIHRDGILHTSTVPADIPQSLRTDAVLLAGRIMNALGYVGVMGLELFVTSDRLIVNEIAPRVHNSGHWTIEACHIDQFAQHIRAVCGWPLGTGARHSNAVMTNLIGDEASDWKALAQNPENAVHFYGKSESRAGRKMAHVTRLEPL